MTAAPPAGLAIEDRRDRGGKGDKDRKAAKGAGKGTLPKGIRPKTEDGRLCCYAHSKGEKRVESPCRFAHICWWCHGDHLGGGEGRPIC